MLKEIRIYATDKTGEVIADATASMDGERTVEVEDVKLTLNERGFTLESKRFCGASGGTGKAGKTNQP